MISHTLYLESGPKHKTTMVHVLDLLGCIAKGPTTEAALEAAPQAIRQWLSLMQRHGEKVDTTGEFDLKVVTHVNEGTWLGYGDPTPGFAPDFESLTEQDQQKYILHLGWLEEEILEKVRDLPLERLIEEPTTGGRSIYRMLEHVAESQTVYLRYLVGRDEAVATALEALNKTPPEFFLPNLEDFWMVYRGRLETINATERKARVPHGQVLWTARRAFRRMLEHAWEHLVEISERFSIPV